jgi:hypothetical protein
MLFRQVLLDFQPLHLNGDTAVVTSWVMEGHTMTLIHRAQDRTIHPSDPTRPGPSLMETAHTETLQTSISSTNFRTRRLVLDPLSVQDPSRQTLDQEKLTMQT